MFAIGQSVEWGGLLEGTSVTLKNNYPVADSFTYQTSDPDIFVGGDVFTGPRFVIDAIALSFRQRALWNAWDGRAQGGLHRTRNAWCRCRNLWHEAAESLHRRVRPDAHMTIGRDRRYYIELDKADVAKFRT